MAAQQATPRRLKVKGRRSIYYSERSGKRRYEITYIDSDGKRRWHTIDGNLADAEDALRAVETKLRRGERVAPNKVTFGEVAEAWLDSKANIRPRTRDSYEWALKTHLLPRFGNQRIAAVTEVQIATLVADLSRRGYSGWTARAILTPLRHVMHRAVRQGLIPETPMTRLERDERPKVAASRMRILNSDEIVALLDATANDDERALLATAIFTGLRLGEVLGLTWADIDFERGYVHVRSQLDRTGKRVVPKTDQALRSVVLMPALGAMLREHRVRSPFSADGDYVFTSSTGRGRDHTTPRRILTRALTAAELDGDEKGRLRFHDLRHAHASILIAEGRDVAQVAAQLGDTVQTTLTVYAGLFDQARHADEMRAALEARFGKVLETTGGDGRRRREKVTGAEVAYLSASGD